MSAYRIDFHNNRPTLFLFASWVVISSSCIFALYPNWLTAAFLCGVWLPVSYYVNRQLNQSFIYDGSLLLETDHITLYTKSGYQTQGVISATSLLFDAFIAVKITRSANNQWLLFLASSFDTKGWSRLCRAVVYAREKSN